MVVVYRPIEGFPGYEIGDNGKVRSYWKRTAHGRGKGTSFILSPIPKTMKPTPSHGYLRVALSRDKAQSTCRVHVLVLTAFVGPRPPGLQACHKNGKRHDCRLSNLRWGTPSSNQLDRWKHGTMSFHLAKLTARQVRSIVSRFARGESRGELSYRFRVDRGTINRVLRGSSWSHVTGIQYQRKKGPYVRRSFNS